MNQFKGTPGPWTVEDRRNAPLKNIRVVSGRESVCEMSHVHQRDYRGSFRGDHAAADAVDAVGLSNALLIAAAPDVLSALVALMEIQDSTTDCWCEESKPNKCEACMARAAIAKATGEAK